MYLSGALFSFFDASCCCCSTPARPRFSLYIYISCCLIRDSTASIPAQLDIHPIYLRERERAIDVGCARNTGAGVRFLLGGFIYCGCGALLPLNPITPSLGRGREKRMRYGQLGQRDFAVSFRWQPALPSNALNPEGNHSMIFERKHVVSKSLESLISPRFSPSILTNSLTARAPTPSST